jgi:hypothetical protein
VKPRAASRGLVPFARALALVALITPELARAEAPTGYEAAPAGLVHEAVASGPRGAAIPIIVGVQNELGFDKLVLNYRPEGESEFRGREMKLVSAGTYGAEIPREATLGRTVAYYIEARDKEGAPVAGRASAGNPLVIELQGAQPAAVAKVEEEGEGEGLAGRRFFVGLLVGAGAGWATGDGDTNADTMYHPAAFALAGLGQLAPEIGYWVTPTLMISLQGRFEAVTGTTDVYADGRVYHAANYAAAGFLKATWVASRPTRARPFFSLAGGYGQIRHVVTFDTLRACGPTGKDVCVDTISTGPVALGPGAGVFVELGAHVVGVFELDTQLTFPAYSVNLDGNLGLAVRF